MNVLSSRWSWIALALAGWIVASPAAAQTLLKPALPTKGKVVSSVDTSAEQTLSIAGQAIETKSEQNAVMVVEYSAAEGGQIAAKHKIQSLQVNIKAAGMEIAFDSAKPDAEPESDLAKGIYKALQATLKGGWTSIHEPSGKVVAVRDTDKLIEGLDEQTAAMVKSQLDPAYLKERAEYEAGRVPSKPVKAGDTWELTNNARIGGGQTLTFKQQFKYVGTVDEGGKKLHVIEYGTNEVLFSIAADAPLPLKLKSSELKPSEAKGRLLFDNEAGRVVQLEDKVRVKGKLVFTIGEQELPGELDLTLTNSMKERP